MAKSKRRGERNISAGAMPRDAFCVALCVALCITLCVALAACGTVRGDARRGSNAGSGELASNGGLPPGSGPVPEGVLAASRQEAEPGGDPAPELETALGGEPAPVLKSTLGSEPALGHGTLVYGSNGYSAINPALYEHGEINSLLFLGLTAHNGDNEVVPGLASEWLWDAQAMAYTFRLRDGLTFHDGAPLTSADVKFTYEAIMDESNGSEISSDFEGVTSIEAPDEKTVVISLSAPNAAIPGYLATGILPKHLLDGKDLTTDGFNQHPVGAGPFKLESWDMGQSIAMTRFDGFCLGRPKLDRVVFKTVDDFSARALQLMSGELDIAQVTPRDARQFEFAADDGDAFHDIGANGPIDSSSANNPQNPNGIANGVGGSYAILSMDTADYRGVMFNFRHPLWRDNPGLPAALSHAIDREAIVSAVLDGHGQAAYSPLQKSDYANHGIERYAYSPEKASAAIESLGWNLGSDGVYAKDGSRLAFAISAPPTDQTRVNMAMACAQFLRDAGADVTVELAAEPDWQNQAAYLIGWGSPFDPDDHTYKVFAAGKAANYGNYSNPRVDGLLSEARKLEGKEARLPIYQEFQAELSQDPPYIFIAYIDALYAVRDGLAGIDTGTVLGHHGVGIFWNVWEWEWD